MENDSYKVTIIIGAVGVIVVLVAVFWNEIGQLFKPIVEWLARNVLGKGTFDPITILDWAIVIGAILFCIINCIVRSVKDS